MSLISVLMTTLNSGKYVREAIDSVLGQSYQQFEIIVIDGGSNDGTTNYIHEIKDKRIKYNLKKGGRSTQLNYGIEKTKGEYIAIMDSDDIADPRRLQIQIEYMKRNPSIFLLGSWAMLITEDKKVISILKKPLNNQKIKENILAMNGISFPTLVVRKELFYSGLKFNETLQHSEDLEFYIQVPEKFKYANVPEILMQLRQTSNSRSRRNNLCRTSLLNALEPLLQTKLKNSNTINEKIFYLRQLGIANYYYGKSKTAKKLLLLSFLMNPFKILTLRYLLPTLFGQKALNKMKKNIKLRYAARMMRNILFNK